MPKPIHAASVPHSAYMPLLGTASAFFSLLVVGFAAGAGAIAMMAM